MADVQWYYARNNQRFGPVSAIELKQLADSGNLLPDDLLWREGMESWATAINLRGLFGETNSAESSPAEAGLTPTAALTPSPSQSASLSSADTRGGRSLRRIVRSMQILLWVMCVLVVLAGSILFTHAFLVAKDAAEEAAAAAVSCAFFIAAYVLARAGEKLSQLLLAPSRRRR